MSVDRYPARWGEETSDPDWAVTPTAEWEAVFPGQRYPGDHGDQGPRQLPPSRNGDRASVAVGWATVYGDNGDPLRSPEADQRDDPDAGERRNGANGRRNGANLDRDGANGRRDGAAGRVAGRRPQRDRPEFERDEPDRPGSGRRGGHGRTPGDENVRDHPGSRGRPAAAYGSGPAPRDARSGWREEPDPEDTQPLSGRPPRPPDERGAPRDGRGRERPGWLEPRRPASSTGDGPGPKWLDAPSGPAPRGGPGGQPLRGAEPRRPAAHEPPPTRRPGSPGWQERPGYDQPPPGRRRPDADGRFPDFTERGPDRPGDRRSDPPAARRADAATPGWAEREGQHPEREGQHPEREGQHPERDGRRPERDAQRPERDVSPPRRGGRFLDPVGRDGASRDLRDPEEVPGRPERPYRPQRPDRMPPDARPPGEAARDDGRVPDDTRVRDDTRRGYRPAPVSGAPTGTENAWPPPPPTDPVRRPSRHAAAHETEEPARPPLVPPAAGLRLEFLPGGTGTSPGRAGEPRRDGESGRGQDLADIEPAASELVDGPFIEPASSSPVEPVRGQHSSAPAAGETTGRATESTDGDDRPAAAETRTPAPRRAPDDRTVATGTTSSATGAAQQTADLSPALDALPDREAGAKSGAESEPSRTGQTSRTAQTSQAAGAGEAPHSRGTPDPVSDPADSTTGYDPLTDPIREPLAEARLDPLTAPVPDEPADPLTGPLPDDPVPVSAAPATSPPGSPVAEASPDTVLPVGPASGAATALAAPTMLAPIVRPGEPPETGQVPPPPAEPEPERPADPEQVLSSYQWRFHHETLRELVEEPDELRAIRDRLTEKVDPATDNRTRARLLSLRAVVSRILGDLGKALADGKLALAHAEATGELRRIAIAQARLAHVLQWRGEFAEADRLFEEANSSELPDRLRATMHEHAGRSCYDQGRYMEACNHFERALELRKVEDPELIARTELALDAVFSRVAQNGWGPYPRSREEVLRLHRPPLPTFIEKAQRWGYTGPGGQLVVSASFADVQPFRDGVAWVRRPEARTWELIDESGALLINAAAGWLNVGAFNDGLAWVSRDGARTWVAIDRSNKVVIPAGFDDVRPFRRGIAAVRRLGVWGALDKTGRLVVPPRFDGFTTALTDGRYLDGFTDEGLAIVDLGGRKGVIDRSGRMIVPPAHPALVIHPVAFLVGNGTGKWGALDRRGEPLIGAFHPSRANVMDEIDRLLADTKPVL